MIDARFVEITKWPGVKTSGYAKKSAPFRSSYPQTLDLLESEINHLHGKDVLIQAYFDRKDIRNDGWPRSSSRPKESGVVVTFTSKGKGLSFPCDRFDAWEDNLRAIALSLEALRKVDRYGVTRSNEQYSGFAQLPASDAKVSREDAITFISIHSGWSKDSVLLDIDNAYRAATRKLHPDMPGGSHDMFLKLNECRKAISL